MKNILETDLFLPIKEYFLKQGFLVQGEVKNCDVVCLKDDILICIEIKKSFNLKVLYQALDRKSFSNYVYIAIIRPKNFRKKDVKHMLKLLKELNIGLITVSFSPLKTVQVIFNPVFKNISKTKKQNQILKEINTRNLQTNKGGSTKKDVILTSYREMSIKIACILNVLKSAKASNLKKISGVENCYNILYSNHFGYFEKVDRGIYKLSTIGENMLKEKTFQEAIVFYKKEANKLCLK